MAILAPNNASTGNIQQGTGTSAPANMTSTTVGSNASPASTVSPQSSMQRQGGFATQGIAAGSAPKQQTRFTNIRQYLQANQPGSQRLGQQVGQTVQNKAEKVGQAIQESRQNLQQAQQRTQNKFDTAFAQPSQTQDTSSPVQAGTVGSLQSIVNKAGQGLTEEETNLFQEFLQGRAGQPFLRSDFTQGLDKKNQEFQDIANMTGTETGRRELLTRTVNAPQYSTGETTLDALLLGSSSSNLRNLRDVARQGRTEFNRNVQGLQKEQEGIREAVAQQTQMGQQRAKDLVTGATTDLKTQLEAQATAKRQATQEALSALERGLRTGEAVNPALAERLGLNPRQVLELQAAASLSAGDRMRDRGGFYSVPDLMRSIQSRIGGTATTQTTEPRTTSVERIFGENNPLTQVLKGLTPEQIEGINAQTVADISDYDRYSELMRLANQDAQFLTNRGLAGTADSSVTSVLNPQLQQAQQAARDAVTNTVYARMGVGSDLQGKQFQEYVDKFPVMQSAITSMEQGSPLTPEQKQQASSTISNLVSSNNVAVISDPRTMAAAISQGLLTPQAYQTLARTSKESGTINLVFRKLAEYADAMASTNPQAAQQAVNAYHTFADEMYRRGRKLDWGSGLLQRE